MEPAHPAVHYQKLQISDSEEGEQEVVVHLSRPSARNIIHQKQRETCCRVCAALLLLAIALSFAFYEILYVRPGQTEAPGEGANRTEEEGLEHHHHGEEEVEEGHNHERGVYHHATIITESEICSGIGKDVLMAGGNIIDTGVSATLCLGIVHPHAAGIGGVFSAIFYNATSGITSALNALPMLSNTLKYGVPLTLQGLHLLHQRYGQLGWSEVLEPIVQLANEGFRIDKILAEILMENEERVKSSSLCSLFCYANGSLKEEGSLVANPKLADMLHMAGSRMAEATLPEEMVKYLIQDLPPQEGELLSDAISRSKVALESPLDFELDGLTLYGSPSPAAVNIFANILKEIDPKKNILLDQGLSDVYYQILNASKHAYLKAFRELIPSNASLETSGQMAPSQSFLQFHSAEVGSHLSSADSKGNMLMLSTSLNSSFGSYFLSPSTGILLSDFTIGMDSELLFWACPVLVKLNDDDDILGVGGAGGRSVPLNIAQVIINHFYFEKSLKDASNGPFLHLVLGEDGVPWGSVSEVFNVSSLFQSLSQKEPGVRATSLVLVESHAEHVRAFGSPPQCCPSSGF